MADPITLAEAQIQLLNWLAASTAVATGAQSYSIGGRTLSRADSAEIRESINFWRAEVQRLTEAAAGDRAVMLATWT